MCSRAGRSTSRWRCTAASATLQAETPPLAGLSPVSVVANSRGLRDGMNYGVGMRYDMNSALGLRLEYSRFGRFAGEFGSSLPETDQVTLGVQFRF